MARRGPTAIVCASLAAACVFGPEDSELKKERFDPPAIYRTWWVEAQECSGKQGDFDRLRFFEVLAPLDEDGWLFPCRPDLQCSAFWEPPHDIVLAPAVLTIERFVKHEMLHDLLAGPSPDSRPREAHHAPWFLRCALGL